MEIPLHNIRCGSCHDVTKPPVMTRFNAPGESPIYTVGCPNACAEPFRREIDIPPRQFTTAFERLLGQPHMGQLAADDPRNLFYVPQQAGGDE